MRYVSIRRGWPAPPEAAGVTGLLVEDALFHKNGFLAGGEEGGEVLLGFVEGGLSFGAGGADGA